MHSRLHEYSCLLSMQKSPTNAQIALSTQREYLHGRRGPVGEAWMQGTLFTGHWFWPSTATFMEESCFVVLPSLFHWGSGYVWL